MALLLSAAGCGAGSDVTVCTANFAYFGVTVVDASNQPVSASWVVSDTVRRTGRALSITQAGASTSYPAIFSDNNLHDVSEGGDSVRVTGVGAGRSFGAWYQFGSAGGCHIQRIAGPDTVVAR